MGPGPTARQLLGQLASAAAPRCRSIAWRLIVLLAVYTPNHGRAQGADRAADLAVPPGLSQDARLGNDILQATPTIDAAQSGLVAFQADTSLQQARDDLSRLTRERAQTEHLLFTTTAAARALDSRVENLLRQSLAASIPAPPPANTEQLRVQEAQRRAVLDARLAWQRLAVFGPNDLQLQAQALARLEAAEAAFREGFARPPTPRARVRSVSPAEVELQLVDIERAVLGLLRTELEDRNAEKAGAVTAAAAVEASLVVREAEAVAAADALRDAQRTEEARALDALLHPPVANPVAETPLEISPAAWLPVLSRDAAQAMAATGLGALGVAGWALWRRRSRRAVATRSTARVQDIPVQNHGPSDPGATGQTGSFAVSRQTPGPQPRKQITGSAGLPSGGQTQSQETPLAPALVSKARRFGGGVPVRRSIQMVADSAATIALSRQDEPASPAQDRRPLQPGVAWQDADVEPTPGRAPAQPFVGQGDITPAKLIPDAPSVYATTMPATRQTHLPGEDTRAVATEATFPHTPVVMLAAQPALTLTFPAWPGPASADTSIAPREGHASPPPALQPSPAEAVPMATLVLAPQVLPGPMAVIALPGPPVLAPKAETPASCALVLSTVTPPRVPPTRPSFVRSAWSAPALAPAERRRR